jgi:hypothetical protein
VRDEVEDVFLEVRPRAADGVDLALAIISASDTPSSAVLIAGQRHHHRSARLEVRDVGEGGVVERGGDKCR